jgi:hypothetical protein
VGTVQAQAIMSLDGYVAKQDNTIGRLFDWLQNGEIAIPTPAGDFTVHLAPPSAEHWRRWTSSLGALVCGRTLFEVAVARAQELAGDGVVTVAGGTIARQCLDLGLLDEVAVDLVPVVMGEGNRPFFGTLSSQDVLLGDPTVCIPGERVTHLVFPVLR